MVRRGVLLLILLVSVCPASTAAQGERLVLAFYYAWFDWDTWSKPLPYQPVEPYLSADVVTIERHVQQAKQAGIDALVQAWYGPSMENNQTEANFWSLLEQAQVHGMQAAVSVDMGSPHFLQTPDDVLSALIALRDRHTQHAAYLRVGGRPVIFFWRQEKFSVASWEALRTQVDPQRRMLWIAEGAHPEYLEVFDGLYLYSVAWADDPRNVLVRWGEEVRRWSDAHDGAFRYWVATVMPGYNDFATGRADAFVRERGDGAFYRTCWEGAMRSGADWVIITSFNEWLEGTQIEPATEYGDAYLTLTASLAAQYRSMATLPTDTPAPATPTPSVQPSPTATSPATPTLPPPTATVTPTATALPAPTPVPSPTRVRLPTPTPTASFQQPPPTAALPPAPTVLAWSAVTPTPKQYQLLTVEGTAARSRLCRSPFALLLFVAWVVWRTSARKS